MRFAVGNEIALVLYGGRDEQFFANHHIWFTHSKDAGATWAPMVVVADDGGSTMGAPGSTLILRGQTPRAVIGSATRHRALARAVTQASTESPANLPVTRSLRAIAE